MEVGQCAFGSYGDRGGIYPASTRNPHIKLLVLLVLFRRMWGCESAYKKTITNMTFVRREQMRYIKDRIPMNNRKKAQVDSKPGVMAVEAGALVTPSY